MVKKIFIISFVILFSQTANAMIDGWENTPPWSGPDTPPDGHCFNISDEWLMISLHCSYFLVFFGKFAAKTVLFLAF